MIEDQEYAARADVMTDEAFVERVDAASLAKYGWQERVVRFFRTGPPDLLKVSPVE